MFFNKALGLFAATLLANFPLSAASPVSSFHKRSTGYVNTVYFASSDIYNNYNVSSLPVSKISNVVYAFTNVTVDGTVLPSDPWADYQKPFDGDNSTESGNAYGNVKQLYKLKKSNRNVKVQLSVGGYSGSVNMSAATSTDATRSNFASTAVNLMKDWGFDGIDIDYEFPNTTSAGNNFSLLLKAIREELDSYSKQYANNYHFLLSIAVSSSASNYGLLPLKDIAANVDYFNLMAYDYTGSWSTVTGHQANLYNSTSNPDSTPISTDSAIKAYIAAGASASQIVLGMPIYGRSFESTAGLGKSFNGTGFSSFGAGVWSYKDLPKANATEKYDNETVAAYSYDPTTQELISYDTPTSVKQKVTYLKTKGLGGSMFWEVSADGTGSRSLVAASYSSLGNLTSVQNCLSYPNSTYTNIKNNLS